MGRVRATRWLAGGLLAAAGGGLAGGGTAAAQEPGELVTDRPDRTESAAAVGPGFVQLEVGWTFRRFGGEGEEVRAHSLPETLLRVGLVERLELRAGFAGWSTERTETPEGAARRDGLGDVEVGAKLVVSDARGAGPAVALLGSATLPTGQDGFGAPRVDPAFRLAAEHDLSPRVSLAVNAGVEWTSEEDPDGALDTGAGLLYTAALGLALTERLGAFAEVFGSLEPKEGREDGHALDGGLTFLVSPNLQLDAAAGVGLSGAADDWFVGAGLSLRLPR